MTRKIKVILKVTTPIYSKNPGGKNSTWIIAILIIVNLFHIKKECHKESLKSHKESI